ncbi:hypothetical protein BCR35DRAFT_354835 [Leucosporidium creatinivorum]|uniref:Nucleotide-diphospho-sugar transferase domain-containing protein n=1 Tax=Leucosporidium creatinivorum TaxID=106004 RepID=A0A1Y2E5E2_9BASI|nr:hypothetical protein BCR35DRAFT_354835 [Leucosporidium creatinivorum]
MRGGASINLPLPGSSGGSHHTDPTFSPFSRAGRKLGLVVLVALLIVYSLTRSGSGSVEGGLAQRREEEVGGLKEVGEVYPEEKEREEEVVDYRRPTPDEDDDEEERPSTSSGGSLSKTLLAKDGTTFTSYLDYHFPLTSPSQPAPHLWLTLSDGHWATTGTHALHTFVQRLNSEREAAGRGDGRRTELVVLCLDEGCVRNCEERGVYAYGGYQFTRPEKILVATWPKLAGLIEVLKHRDVFFVDSDVAFKYDPYPYMEKYMKTHDLIAQENEAFDHFNTGWMWMKKSAVTSEAWNQVLKRDLKKVSRDQNNFNEILGTTELRHCDPSDCLSPTSRLPLKMDFTALNGLKVHILDAGVFRSHHFEVDLPMTQRHESVSLHMTCGDDALTKEYVSKAQGFWGDVKGYYADPPKLLTIDHLSGNRTALIQKMKILLMAAHYTSRALLPPSHATFTDLPPLDSSGNPTIPVRHIFSSFPLPHLQSALGVKIVEPSYPSLASQFLVGASVLGKGRRRKDEGWWRGSEEERVGLALEMHEVAELDMRHVRSFAELHSLLSSPSFSTARTIRLMNLDVSPNSKLSTPTNWAHWTMPTTLSNVKPCYRVWDPPSCEAICRFEGRREVTVPEGEGWEALERVLSRKEKWEVKEMEERVKNREGKERVGLMLEDQEAEEEEDAVEEEAVAEFGHLEQEKGGGKKGGWEKVYD